MLQSEIQRMGLFTSSTTDRIFQRRRRRRWQHQYQQQHQHRDQSQPPFQQQNHTSLRHRTLWMAILVAVASQHSTGSYAAYNDDDIVYYDDDSSNSANENDNSDSSSSSSKHDGYHDVQAFCRHNHIRVTGLWLTCDTPGAYYYGSGAYRASEVCMSGDKANLQVAFTIPNDVRVKNISLEIESGLYGKFQSVRNATSVCSQLHVKSASSYGGNECPYPGQYTLTTYFTMPSIRDYELHYTPDIKLTFTDPANTTQERIGCSTTGTLAIHRAAQDKSLQGMVALGICILSFCIIFAVLLCLSYQRKKRIEKHRERRYEEHLHNDYHYFRTLPNGQVIPVSGPPSGPPGSGDITSMSDSNTLGVAAPPLQRDGPKMVLIPSNPDGDSNNMNAAISLDSSIYHRHRSVHDSLGHQDVEDDHDDDDEYDEDDLRRSVFDISNPSYNEPQIPTRPII